MIRSLLAAIVTVVFVSAFGVVDEAAAKKPIPASIPIDITGATAGVRVEVYMNNSKQGDVTVDALGQASWVFQMTNSTKNQFSIYVDVCHDGKTVKVLVVTGQPPPEDKNCNRHLVIAAFWNDCGVTRVTLDLTRFGGKVFGCDRLITRPLFYVPIAAGAGLLGFLAGGDGATTSSVVTPTPVATAAPTPTPTPTPTPAPAPTPATFTVTLVLSFTHPTGTNFSVVCGVIMTNPAQPGATHTVALSGPAVVPNQNIFGTLTPSGQAAFEGRIQQVGSYTVTVSVRSTTNVQSTATGVLNVTGGNSSCPTAR